MRLKDLKPVEGSRRKLKRVGRGIATGCGKTCDRGHRGQKCRSGYSKRMGFEGGQTPLYRRLPKIHNFDYVRRRTWVHVNVGTLNKFEDGAEVTPQTLVELNILDKASDSLRVLGNGDLNKKLTVKAHHFSQSAIDKIQQAGGSYEVIQPAKQVRGRIPLGK